MSHPPPPYTLHTPYTQPRVRRAVRLLWEVFGGRTGEEPTTAIIYSPTGYNPPYHHLTPPPHHHPEHHLPAVVACGEALPSPPLHLLSLPPPPPTPYSCSPLSSRAETRGSDRGGGSNHPPYSYTPPPPPSVAVKCWRDGDKGRTGGGAGRGGRVVPYGGAVRWCRWCRVVVVSRRGRRTTYH